MKKVFEQFKSEDWIIVFTGYLILALSLLLPQHMPFMPKELASGGDVAMAAKMFVFVSAAIFIATKLLKRTTKGLFFALLLIFTLSLGAQVVANIPFIKELGLESVFFSVIFGLIISNFMRVPQWVKPAIQSEFYIKIGIVCLGSTVLFSQVLESGGYGLMQSLLVVIFVWYFSFWVSRRIGVDREMGTLLSSAVSICGVSAAIATCGVIKGDNKRLSYVISLVLVCAIPMMYIMPWLSELMGLNQEVAGAWLGGTIDTTGAVAASGTMLGDKAAETAIIVKSSQNVLLGVAAFAISLYWSYNGTQGQEKPSLGVIWDRFPKFVVGFIIASLVFSFVIDIDSAKEVGKISKGMTNTLFSIAFVCIGLETRFKEIFSKENRKPFAVFMIAQTFNIIATLIIAYLMFGVLKPYLA